MFAKQLIAMLVRGCSVRATEPKEVAHSVLYFDSAGSGRCPYGGGALRGALPLAL